jgi:hypothetical protein
MSLRNFARIVPVLAVAASLVFLPTAAAFATETGGSIDPDGAVAEAADHSESGMTIDPNG